MKDTKLNLQLFADGGDGGDAGETAPAPDVAEDVADKATRWQELIGKDGEFHEEYKKGVEGAVNKRFSKVNEMQERIDRSSKLSAFLADRYGKDEDDFEGMLEALQNDDALFEAQAAERGLSTDQYKELKKLEYENQMLNREREENERAAEVEKIYADWIRQADEVRAQFPEFDFEAEMENPDFVGLLEAGVSVDLAFKVTHEDEILGGAMQYAAQTAANKVTEGIRAKGLRPVENAVGRSSRPVKETIDVENLSLEDINKLTERARHGERIEL